MDRHKSLTENIATPTHPGNGIGHTQTAETWTGVHRTATPEKGARMAINSLPQIKAGLASKDVRKFICGRKLPSGELCDGRVGYLAITPFHHTQ